jgi:3-oxoacyl-[acyl-carrier-protein] synthase II
MKTAVVITGVGSVNAAFVGGTDALLAWLEAPRSVLGALPGSGAPASTLGPAALGRLIDETETRRLSRVCQLSVAAARLALGDAGLGAGAEIGLVLGSELGDLRSTGAFAEGYLGSGPSGLSALLFPNTVMNTMASATTIAVAARGLSLTLNARMVAGELAVARAAAAVAGGRATALLAGGVDEIEPRVARTLVDLGAVDEVHGEGATFLVLEARDAALARGARILGEIAGAAARALRARPHGVGRSWTSRAIGAALAEADLGAEAIGWVYASSGGDRSRDAWQARLLDGALGPGRPPRTSLRPLFGEHAGVGALGVAAAARTARSGWLPGPDASLGRVTRGPGLVHALARGGSEVALVVR